MSLRSELRENLKTWRFKRKMTQEVLAKESGVKRPTIAQFENYGHPKFRELKRICKTLGVSSSDLLGF